MPEIVPNKIGRECARICAEMVPDYFLDCPDLVTNYFLGAGGAEMVPHFVPKWCRNIWGAIGARFLSFYTDLHIYILGALSGPNYLFGRKLGRFLEHIWRGFGREFGRRLERKLGCGKLGQLGCGSVRILGAECAPIFESTPA